MGFWSEKRILVTGAAGFLGRHLVESLRAAGARNVTTVGHKDFDLTQEEDVKRMYSECKPEAVFNLAGLVGGILANKERPGDFFYRNLMIGTLVMHYASKSGVKKFVSVGAGCGYPEHTQMPLKETSLWDGWPQKESAPYSLAKRMLTIQSAAYFQQYGFESIVCIPGNIYGEYDNFNLHESHVIPALVRKFVEAKRDEKPFVEVWGSGTPTRDYVYAGDVAKGMIKGAEKYNGSAVINLSSGKETSVKEICDSLQQITGFKGKIQWLTDKPEGQKRRWFDVSKARKDLGFDTPTSLQDGLKKTVDWYLENINSKELRR